MFTSHKSYGVVDRIIKKVIADSFDQAVSENVI